MKRCSRKKHSVNRVLALAMSLCMLFAMFDPGMMIYASETGSDAPAGSGTAKSPYEIGTVEELLWFADYVNQGNTGACAILTADIDMRDRAWTPIAARYACAYTGTFDGMDHTISNLTITPDSNNPAGLFGVLGRSTVKNINLENAVADGRFYMLGFIAGRSDNGHIVGCNVNGTLNAASLTGGGGGIVGENKSYVSDCTFTGSIFAPAAGHVGGIAGKNSHTISECVNEGIIEGSFNSDGTLHMSDYLGGIVGDDQDSLIQWCENKGNIIGGSYVGGIAGISRGDSIIGDCVNTGNVSAEYGNRVGGIAGKTSSGTDVIECGNTGMISNTKRTKSALAGGIVGWAEKTSITKCWNHGTIETADQTEAGGLVGQNDGSSVSDSYTIGAVNGTGANTGAAIGAVDENAVLSNIYYLEGSYGRAVGNAETAPEAVMAKQEAAFHSGEVAWLLRGGRNSSPGWAQDLSDETGFPELLSGKKYIVYRVTDSAGTTACFYNKQTLTADELAADFNISEKDGYKLLFYVREADGSLTLWQGGEVDRDLTVEYRYEKIPPDGEGTEESPYLIGTQKELLWFAEKVKNGDVDVCAELTADINLAGITWEPMCRLKNYVGVFDGKDHTIFNMTVTSEDSYNSTSVNAGFFGLIGKGGMVKNIKLAKATVSGGVQSAGLIASQNAGGTVENCTVSGDVTVTSSKGGVGGVVGYNSGTVRGCAFSGTVTGESKIGGIVGENGSYSKGFENATVEDCVNNGTITSDGSGRRDYVGGIVGYNGQAGARIISCENHGKVAAKDYVGGIAGYSAKSYGGFSNLIEDCVNTEDVASEYGVCAGGIVGYAQKGNVIAKCGNSGAVSRSAGSSTGSARVGGVVGHGIEITVENCWNQGSVDSAQWLDAGGLMGKSEQSHVKNCYTVGEVIGTGANIGMVIGNTDSASVFETIYYLAGTGAAVIGNAEADSTNVIPADETAFASGEVAWLLQKAQEDGAQVWGQDLTATGYPMLSGEKEMAVHCIEDPAGGTRSYFNQPLGDVDGDFKITVLDALNILKYTVASVEFDNVQRNLGDVNRDGETDVVDALDVLKKVAGTLGEFSAEIK